MSLGGGGTCGNDYQAAINVAVAAGATVVVSAGNSNTNASTSQPANCSNVITVAATNRIGGKASYSNYGAVVDVAAPGGETSQTASNGIASTLNDGVTSPGSDTYVWYQGTSMAAPHVAGVAALMYVKDNTLTPDTVEATLKDTARLFPASCSQCGSGIVDAGAAVAAVSGGTSQPPSTNTPPYFTSTDPFSIIENSAVNAVVRTVTAADDDEDSLTFSLVSGNDNSAFAISTAGVLTVAQNVLDFETQDSYSLEIAVNDGHNDNEMTFVSVDITDDLTDNASSDIADNDGDGWYTPEDCDDEDPHTYPGHNDTRGKWGKNDVDNDCDGEIDA